MTSTAGPALPSGVRLGTLGELPAVFVDTPACTAELVLQGAQLVRWQPAGHDPVLFASSRAIYRPGTAVRGGIPLCGPWFGPGRSGDRTPAHGFYRISPWRLTGADADPDGTVTLRLELTAADVTAAFWPQEAVLELTARLGRDLELTLSTTAGADGLDLEEALHTYLVVGDVRQVRVLGLDGVDYADKTAAGARVVQRGDVTLSGETDRVYDVGGPTTIVDPVLGRRIDIAPAGSGSTVVWNPWETAGGRVADLDPDAWTGMLCVETANVLDAAAVIPPDTTHSLSAHIRVTRV